MRIAVAELPGARLDEWEAVLGRITDRVARAAALGAELLVLPECAFPAYVLGTRAAYDSARRAGLPPPDVFIQRLQAAARRWGIALCAGFVAEEGDALRNAAAVVAADGTVCGVRHKAFLWDFDRDYFTPAEALAPVDTPLGRLGVLICADARLPELPAALVSQGATLLVQPTAWVNAGRPDRPWNPQPDFLIAARAREFGVPIASASKAGWEGGHEFVGGALVCDAQGNVAAFDQRDGAAVVCSDVAVPPAPRPPRRTAALRTLLAERGPVTPPPGNVPPLHVVALAEDAPAARRALRAALPPEALALGIVVPLPARSDAVDAGGLCRRCEEDHGLWVLGAGAGRGCEVELSSPAAGQATIRVAVLPVGDADDFAPARLAALRGAHLVVFAGGTPNLAVLRARACENRVFVAAVGQNLTIIGPSGNVLGQRSPHSGICAARILVGAAASKCVARGTDVFRDVARRLATEVISRRSETVFEQYGSGLEFG